MINNRLLIAFSIVFFTGSAFAAEHISQMDKAFMEKSAQGNKAEVMIGHLGLKKSKNPQVVKISKRLIQDHGEANVALKKVIEENGAQMPKNVNSEQKATCHKLSTLQGKAFDDTFIKVGLADHTKDIKAYQKEIKEGESKSVKDYASTYLPKIEEHKKLFEEAEKSK